MLSSDEFERSQRQNVQKRRAFINRWAEYVRTHDDEEWSRQQNKLIDSRLQSANEMARDGDTESASLSLRRIGIASLQISKASASGLDLEAVHRGAPMYELTTLGYLYLAGELDAESLPRRRTVS